MILGFNLFMISLIWSTMFGFEALLQFQEMILVDITEMYKEIRKERDN